MKKPLRTTLLNNPIPPADIFKPPQFQKGQQVKLLDVLHSDIHTITDVSLMFHGYVYSLSPVPVAHSFMQLEQNLTLVSCETTAITTSEA